MAAFDSPRWKNSDGFLTGKLLIAMPGMADIRFEKSVIFVCSHSPEGALGLIVNKPLEGLPFRDLMAQMDRDRALRTALEPVRALYDVILIDCPPSLGLLTINALTAAASVIVPLQTAHLSVRGPTPLIPKTTPRPHPSPTPAPPCRLPPVPWPTPCPRSPRRPTSPATCERRTYP